MSFLRKIFNPTSTWEPAAAAMGGEFERGGILKAASIRLHHGPHLIEVKPKYGSEKDSTTYTRVTAELPLKPGVMLALSRNMRGQGMMSRLASMIGQGVVELPALGEECLVLATDAKLAEGVFMRGGFVDALRNAPDSLKVEVGGDPVDPETSTDVSILRPRLLTDPDQLVAMVVLMRALLDGLQEAGSLEG